MSMAGTQQEKLKSKILQTVKPIVPPVRVFARLLQLSFQNIPTVQSMAMK